MSNHGTALTTGQRAEFLAAAIRALATDVDKLDPATAEYWTRHVGRLRVAFSMALERKGEDLLSINWKLAYQELGMKSEFTTFLAEKMTNYMVDTDDTWAVPVLPGVTPMKVVKALREHGVNAELFSNNLDKEAIGRNQRDPEDGSYVVRFRKTIEADLENAHQSALDRERKNIKDITLLERLLLELGYFLSTGHHLDIESTTLCAGTRISNGDVPHVFWWSPTRKLSVDVSFPNVRCSSPRSRTVVAVH